jgi:hypothetical protein
MEEQAVSELLEDPIVSDVVRAASIVAGAHGKVLLFLAPADEDGCRHLVTERREKVAELVNTSAVARGIPPSEVAGEELLIAVSKTLVTGGVAPCFVRVATASLGKPRDIHAVKVMSDEMNSCARGQLDFYILVGARGGWKMHEKVRGKL